MSDFTNLQGLGKSLIDAMPIFGVQATIRRDVVTSDIGNWRRSGVLIVSFKHFSHLVLVFLLLTLNMQMQAG